MGMVMAVSFTRYGRLYYLDPGEHRPRVGDHVLVPTSDGAEVAQTVWAPEWVDDVEGLPVCAGPATDTDLERDERNRKRRADAKATARRMVRQHGLPMKVVAVDFTDQRADVDQLVTIYFSAPHRVDFRTLVRDLARELRARVDLRHLGARDEARVQGGIGPCGRDLCCATFLVDFEPIGMKVVKDQDLPPNPLKISGACGRLMCCLKYEHPLYQQFQAEAPAIGSTVQTPDGTSGTVVGHHVPAGTVLVKEHDTGRKVACPKASVCAPRQAYESSHPDASPPLVDPGHPGGCGG